MRKNKNFNLLIGSQLFSVLGTTIVQFVISLYVGASSATVHVALEDLGAKSITHLSRKTAPIFWISIPI